MLITWVFYYCYSYSYFTKVLIHRKCPTTSPSHETRMHSVTKQKNEREFPSECITMRKMNELRQRRYNNRQSSGGSSNGGGQGGQGLSTGAAAATTTTTTAAASTGEGDVATIITATTGTGIEVLSTSEHNNPTTTTTTTTINNNNNQKNNKARSQSRGRKGNRSNPRTSSKKSVPLSSSSPSLSSLVVNASSVTNASTTTLIKSSSSPPPPPPPQLSELYKDTTPIPSKTGRKQEPQQQQQQGVSLTPTTPQEISNTLPPLLMDGTTTAHSMSSFGASSSMDGTMAPILVTAAATTTAGPPVATTVNESQQQQQQHQQHQQQQRHVAGGVLTAEQVRKDELRWHKIGLRIVIGSLLMVTFGSIVYLGHVYICILVAIIETLLFYELVRVRYSAFFHNIKDTIPLFRTTQWMWFAVAMFYTYGDFVSDLVQNNHETWSHLVPYIPYTGSVALILYSTTLIVTIVTLQREHLKFQINQLCWTVVVLCLTLGQLKYVMHNIFNGLIWFVLPVCLVIINDVMAYACGITTGRKFISRPFLTFSPNKTWEGFLGGGFFYLGLCLVFE